MVRLVVVGCAAAAGSNAARSCRRTSSGTLASGAEGIDPAAVQDLGLVDVADPGGQPLIEEGDRDLGARVHVGFGGVPAQRLVEIGLRGAQVRAEVADRIEVGPERLPPDGRGGTSAPWAPRSTPLPIPGRPRAPAGGGGACATAGPVRRGATNQACPGAVRSVRPRSKSISRCLPTASTPVISTPGTGRSPSRRAAPRTG